VPEHSLSLQSLAPEKLPRHVAIILDGNGRWATSRGLPRIEGHRKGAERLLDLFEFFLSLNIPYLSLYVFSTENWKRPRHEIDALFQLLSFFIDENLKILKKNRIRMIVSGDISPLPAAIQNKLNGAIVETAKDYLLTVNLCLNYGSRAEILRAAKDAILFIQKGQTGQDLTDRIESISESQFEQYLYTKDLPDVDLLIRTAGEQRLSNYLLWQSAYAELFFTPVLWPDFSNDDMFQALLDYQRRIRKFGSI